MAQKRRATVEIDDIYEVVEQIAKTHRRAMAAQMRLFVDEALVMRGVLTPESVQLPPDTIEAMKNYIDKEPFSEDEDEEVRDLCCDFLKRLAAGEKVANGELAALAHLLGVRPEILKRIRDRYLDGEVKNDQSIAAS